MRRVVKTSEAERERKRLYYLANREAMLAKSKLYKQNNPEKVRQHTATYRERYRLELRMRAGIYYWRQGASIRLRQRQRYAADVMLTYRRVVSPRTKNTPVGMAGGTPQNTAAARPGELAGSDN